MKRGMSDHGTKRTCRGVRTMFAPEGRTDMLFRRGNFRF
jgi:hypothetical protein